ncbi:uncharacterized protein BX663DRAFT_482069 [Cokeromyces recurvatus]|uniref:uncharacterized protein n=1 Tax=Cokeromyces recurvatus TaxID=90255 RepID=UPI00222127EC|nr:uncharacterized protein BX663DRAFT_482069 [Cokeromyces recurvatus]KAI7907794.1 hypothetical protein BX663DRAFT_482069 [Cokeromyces recurvatus]
MARTITSFLIFGLVSSLLSITTEATLSSRETTVYTNILSFNNKDTCTTCVQRPLITSTNIPAHSRKTVKHKTVTPYYTKKAHGSAHQHDPSYYKRRVITKRIIKRKRLVNNSTSKTIAFPPVETMTATHHQKKHSKIYKTTKKDKKQNILITPSLLLNATSTTNHATTRTRFRSTKICKVMFIFNVRN